MSATDLATSPNFGFLAKHYPELERIGARSERYFTDDPVISLITIRRFGEVLAQLAAAGSGLFTDAAETIAGTGVRDRTRPFAIIFQNQIGYFSGVVRK